ncbi:MAG: hypothetical protein A4E53_00424 [Pelotomaculum sp. PtaB.Bin104]|nr:MAG: hypothetical protein A4E53_00424 [Pelotomaculum sp. PtaB.Bin104]
MKGIIFSIVGLLVGIAILGAGLYYLIKEKDDKESRKIYSIVSIVGAVILIGIIVKIIVFGF